VAARHDVGYLPEAPYFYRHLSGRELVRFYARLCGLSGPALAARVKDVLALVGMSEAADRSSGTYSKGMLQRIGLAQAIVHDPRRADGNSRRWSSRGHGWIGFIWSGWGTLLRQAYGGQGARKRNHEPRMQFSGSYERERVDDRPLAHARGYA